MLRVRYEFYYLYFSYNINCNVIICRSMQSARSGLTMVGTVVVGRLSDKCGRAVVLWIGTAASIFSYLINLHGNSITALWVGLIPSALLNHNFSVLKVVVIDIILSLYLQP